MTAGTGIMAGAAGGLGLPRRALAIGAVLTAMTLVVLDASVANLALPSIARALEVGSAQAILVVTAYQAALIMLLLPCGALGERFGYRRVFSGGVALFTLASLLCAAASSLPWLLAGRFLQGTGGAAVLALGVPLLRFSVPASRFGSAIGWNAMTVALASAAGPSLGALVLTAADWPWLFALNLPLGAAALLAGRALPAAAGTGRPIDPAGMALNAALFGSLVLAAELLVKAPLAAAGLFGLAGLALTALLRRERGRASPLLPLDLLRAPSFRVSALASVCCFSGTTAALVALPFHLQHGFGLSPLAAGLQLTAWPLAVMVTAPVSGRLSDRVSTAWPCAFGGLCLSAGLAGMALWPQASGPGALVVFMVLCGIGFGLFQTPNNRSLYLSAPAERSGAAGGMQGTARLTGQTAGAVLTSLLLAATAMETAPRLAFGLAAGLALASGAASLLRLQVRPAPRGSV